MHKSCSYIINATGKTKLSRIISDNNLEIIYYISYISRGQVTISIHNLLLHLLIKNNRDKRIQMSLLWLFVFNLYSASSAKSLNAVWKSQIDSMFITKIGNNISATMSLIFLYGWDDYIGFFRWVLDIDLHFATQSLCTHASANYVLILFNTIIGTKTNRSW